MRRRLLVFLLVGLATGGCASVGNGASVLELDGGVTAYVNVGGGGPETAALGGGELVVVDGGCVALRSGEQLYFFGMPHGTVISSDGAGITSPEGETYPLGTSVAVGGGGVDDASWKSTVRSRWPSVPEACLRSVSGFFGSSDFVHS